MTETVPHIIACDIDGTLFPSHDTDSDIYKQSAYALEEIQDRLALTWEGSLKPTYFGCITGNTTTTLKQYADMPHFKSTLRITDFVSTAVGSEIYYWQNERLARDTEWPRADSWDTSHISRLLAHHAELSPQGPDTQTYYKLSYEVKGVSSDDHYYPGMLQRQLGRAGVDAEVIFSHGMYVDILPRGVHKGAAVKQAAYQLSPHERPYLVAAGDSMNDRTLLAIADMAILPGNAHDDLKEWASTVLPPQRLYIAEQQVAAGVLEGLLKTSILS